MRVHGDHYGKFTYLRNLSEYSMVRIILEICRYLLKLLRMKTCLLFVLDHQRLLNPLKVTAGYKLNKFFNESPELRLAFYFPDDRCGPDIIFFVEFEDKVMLQVKLHYSV